MSNWPKYALYRGHKVRVIQYERDSLFLILDQNDQYRRVHSRDLIFVP